MHFSRFFNIYSVGCPLAPRDRLPGLLFGSDPRTSPAFLAVSRTGRKGFFTFPAPSGKPQFQAYNTVICYFYTSQKPPAYFEMSFLLKGTRAAGRNDGFQRWGKNYKARSALWCRKTRQCSNDDAHVQGHGSQLERAPTGQTRGSLNPEVKKTVQTMSRCMKQTGVHTDINKCRS